MPNSRDKTTTAENLEDKFNRGEDVLDYFDVRKARVVRPKSKQRAATTKFIVCRQADLSAPCRRPGKTSALSRKAPNFVKFCAIFRPLDFGETENREPHKQDQLAIVLEIVRQLMGRLIKLHIIRARHDHHDHATVLVFLDRAAELRTFCP
jgi:hypothetical protein